MEKDPIFVGIKKAAAALDVSPRTVTYLIARGELETKRIGRRRLIPWSAPMKFARR
jgi:excisionase family DNA binding protein